MVANKENKIDKLVSFLGGMIVPSMAGIVATLMHDNTYVPMLTVVLLAAALVKIAEAKKKDKFRLEFKKFLFGLCIGLPSGYLILQI